MSKRRLSGRQQARILENQQKELVDNRSDADASRGHCNGRIISHFGQHLDVESLDPELAGKIVRCHQRANLPSLVTGDLVLWEEDGAKSGVILARGERLNVFGRPDAAGNLRPVAANIDLVLVMIASAPTPHMNLIDRYLVAIEIMGLQPLLILNKVDLIQDEDSADLDNMLSIYEKIGYSPHRVSALSDIGIAQLEDSLRGKTTVLVGQSGVGKSSLINRLGPEIEAKVGALSQTRDQGTHTTTTSTLFHLDSCDLIDSPGIREFGLDHIKREQLFDGFVEFRPLVGKCKFRDCSHRTEPDCALHNALEAGELSQRRFDSYFQILNSLT